MTSNSKKEEDQALIQNLQLGALMWMLAYQALMQTGYRFTDDPAYTNGLTLVVLGDKDLMEWQVEMVEHITERMKDSEPTKKPTVEGHGNA